MVKAPLAILIIGLGANQAFTSDDGRDRHWAEGVYFSPVTAASTLRNPSPSTAIAPAQRTMRKRWPEARYYGSLNQLPQFHGYPDEGYDPYRTTENGINEFFSDHSSEYVPRNYIPRPLKEHNEYGTGYRVNGFNNRENHYNDGYRNDMNGYAHKRDRDQRDGIQYDYGYDPVYSDYHSGGYGKRSDSRGYLDAAPLDDSQSLDIPYYGPFLSDIHYFPDWNPSQSVDEFGSLLNPWELLCPLSNSGLPYYPLW